MDERPLVPVVWGGHSSFQLGHGAPGGGSLLLLLQETEEGGQGGGGLSLSLLRTRRAQGPP